MSEYFHFIPPLPDAYNSTKSYSLLHPFARLTSFFPYTMHILSPDSIPVSEAWQGRSPGEYLFGLEV